MVDIVQPEFRNSRIAVKCAWQILFLITKGNRELSGMGIMEFICKVVMGVVNCHIGAAVVFKILCTGSGHQE